MKTQVLPTSFYSTGKLQIAEISARVPSGELKVIASESSHWASRGSLLLHPMR